MKHWITGIALALVLGMAGPGRVLADTPQQDVTKHPGYVDFGTVNLFGKEPPEVEILLERALIDMVKIFSEQSDPELADMLSKLQQIRVQVFPIDPAKLDVIEQKTTEVSSKLESQGWARIIKVHHAREGDLTYVYLKMKDNKVQGFALMNVDPDEDKASFVNIVGEVDPEQLGKLQRKFDIHGMDSLEVEMKELKGKTSTKP